MKEVIGKGKLVNNSLPKHLILNNRNIFDQKTIANSFNEASMWNTSIAKIIWDVS